MNQRLFVALDLPDEIREALARWAERELIDGAIRPVSAQSLHMTVCFLGWTPEERLGEAIEVIAGIEPRPVRVRLSREPVAKPPRGPGLFAVEGESPGAAAIAAEVRGPMVELGLAEEERRPFWPHVTVARVRSERREKGRRRRPQRVERPPGPLPEELGGEFGAVRLSLYRSMMRRDGSLYVPLYNLDLR